MSDTSAITVVWSSYGHQFMGTDAPNHEQCLRCGAMFELVPDDEEDPSHGAYVAADGSEPIGCPGASVAWRHGYPGERYCDLPECDPSEPCEHVDHDCNCLFCDS